MGCGDLQGEFYDALPQDPPPRKNLPDQRHAVTEKKIIPTYQDTLRLQEEAPKPHSTQQPRKLVRRNPQSQLFKLDENEDKMDYEQALEQYQDQYTESDRTRKETSVLHMGLPDTSRSYCLPCQGDAPRDERPGIEVKLDIDVDSVDEEDEALNIVKLFY